MLIVISQVLLLLVALALPLRRKKKRVKDVEIKKEYKIDTDTHNANYAINEFGTLEKIDRHSWTDEKPEMEN